MKLARVVTFVAVAAALVMPSTGAAATTTANVACIGSPASVLGALPGAASTARGSGGFQRDRDTRGIAGDSSIPAGQEPAISDSFTATIPVWFHVIAASKSPRDGWVSDDQIARQIDVLNQTFGGAFGGADTGFRFELAGVTRTINSAWFEMATFAVEIEVKQALKRGDATTLNLYSNSGAGYLGFAYYPSIVTNRYEILDGIVVHFDSMPGGKIPQLQPRIHGDPRGRSLARLDAYLRAGLRRAW